MVPWYGGETERSSYEIGVSRKLKLYLAKILCIRRQAKPRDVLIDPGGNPNPTITFVHGKHLNHQPVFVQNTPVNARVRVSGVRTTCVSTSTYIYLVASRLVKIPS